MLVKKRAGHLSAGDARARDIIGQMSIGECALCTVRRVRNPKLHRKFFALVKFAFDNWRPVDGKEFRNIESFRKELIIAAGFHQTVLGVDGAVRLEAKSVAWDRMGEEEFTPLYEAVVAVLGDGFIPGLTATEAAGFAASLEGF